MNSHEHDAMERNEVLVETINLTSYTHEMEQHAWRCDAMNMAWQGNQQQDDMFVKLSMARASP